MIWRGTLARRLAVLINGGFALIWILAVVASALVLRSEQEEMLNLELRQTAGILHPVMASAYRQGLIGADVAALVESNERVTGGLVFALVDPRGEALLISPGAGPTALPEGAPVEGYARTDGYVVYTTAPDQDGLSLRFGDALEERREAYLDSFLAFIVPMLAILPLGYLLVGWIARSALSPLGALATEIAQRGDARLDPIDGSRQPDELRKITATLNGFMIRLSQALEGERAFATSAAHELRSPVAVALAQVQRLRLETTDSAALDRITRMEEALKRMRSLVARLLQLARAEAGIGPSEAPQDVGELLGLVLAEVAPDPARQARLQVTRPDHPVLSPIDADAFAIVAGNLLDNAFQHAPEDSPVTVMLTDAGTLTVANGGKTFAPADLARLIERFHSGSRSGNSFGLGLYISDRIARQSGGDLFLRSPLSDRTSGFEAVFRLPLPQPSFPGKTSDHTPVRPLVDG